MDASTEVTTGGRERTGKLVVGLLFLGLGTLLLAYKLGLDLPFEIWEAWPVVVVLLGAVKLLTASDPDGRRSGFWILTGGLYCWVSSWRLFGLHWGSAWPIFLVAQGLVIVFDSSFGSCATSKSEVRDGR